MEPSVERLRRALRGLGASRLAPAEEPVQKRPPDLSRLAAMAGGETVAEASDSGYLALRHIYPLHHRHGQAPLSLALEAKPDTLALLAQDARLDAMDPDSAVYFDTETTGLGTATGTLVFLVGVGRFVADGFEVTQYFLPGPDVERPFLEGVRHCLGDHSYLVSYNGKCFDAPLLQTRYLLQRQRLALSQWPHLDLLRAARGLYRPRVPDCRLATIEKLVLGVRREEADVPGYLIPGIYFDYLRSGAVGELARVFYHNLLDVLSLAGLGGTAAATVEGRIPSAHASDHLGAGRLLELAGRMPEAEASYLRALVSARGYERVALLRRLGFLLKRQGDFVRAAEVWRALVESKSDREGVSHTELAKHLEHRARDHAGALAVVDQALASGSCQAPGMREALEHRRRRLLARLAASSTPPAPDEDGEAL